MNEDLAKEFNDLVIYYSDSLNNIAEKLRHELPDEERKKYFEKISHIMTLSTDLLDMIKEEFPSIENQYNDLNKH